MADGLVRSSRGHSSMLTTSYWEDAFARVGDELLIDSCRVLYAYVTSVTRELLYIGKAEGITVRERAFARESRPPRPHNRSTRQTVGRFNCGVARAAILGVAADVDEPIPLGHELIELGLILCRREAVSCLPRNAHVSPPGILLRAIVPLMCGLYHANRTLT